MRPRAGAALLAQLLAAGLALAVPAGASAASTTRADAVGDAEVVVFQSDGDDEVVTTDPDERLTDIEQVRFDLRRQFLVVTAQLREVRGQVGRPGIDVRAGGRSYVLARVAGRKVNVLEVGVRGRFEPCRGASAVQDGARDTIRFRVPVRCIGAPEAARFRFGMTRSASTRDDFRYWSDRTSGFTGRVARG